MFLGVTIGAIGGATFGGLGGAILGELGVGGSLLLRGGAGAVGNLAGQGTQLNNPCYQLNKNAVIASAAAAATFLDGPNSGMTDNVKRRLEMAFAVGSLLFWCAGTSWFGYRYARGHVDAATMFCVFAFGVFMIAASVYHAWLLTRELAAVVYLPDATILRFYLWKDKTCSADFSVTARWRLPIFRIDSPDGFARLHVFVDKRVGVVAYSSERIGRAQSQ